MQTTPTKDTASELAAIKMMRDFENNLRLMSDQESGDEESQDDSDQEFFNDEEEFSFAFDSGSFSTISADDAFYNGQIKPAFPLFDQSLLLPAGDDFETLMQKDRLPKVNRVFLPAGDVVGDHSNVLPQTSSSSSSNGYDQHDDIAGPYCEWSSKVVEAAPDRCKKSNSTGFSKIWRFKDFMHRSNSDGRDAFVFLNHTTPSSGKREEKALTPVLENEKSAPKKKANEVVGEGTVKKDRKTKKASLSAYEVYMRSKAKDADRRRSYLPYRSDVVGLFTNVNGGGLTRNVHPF